MSTAALPLGLDRAQSLARLDLIARFMDSAFRIPGTGMRVGADALLNFIPGAGSVFAKMVSAYLVAEAYRHGAPRPLLAKMVGRVGIDLVLSVIPVVGWVGDMFYRANVRNLDDLKRHLSGAGAS